VLVVLAVIGAAIGSPKNTGSSAATVPAATKVSSSPAPSPTPTLTGGQAKFVAAIRASLSSHGYTNSSTDAQLAAVGTQTCTALASGASQSAVLGAAKGAPNKFSMSPRKFIKLAERDLCRQYLPKTLIRFSGNGILNSAPFNVPSGTVTAHFSYNCGSFGQGNFIADMTDGSDDQSIANALSSGGHQTTTLYPTDTPGQYHLEVDSECSWTIVLTSG
jgi:hypothetical protein